jgi:hypothetical protein
MAKRSILSGKKANIQKSGRHKSGKSRAGTKAFAPRGPHGLRGIKKLKRQDLNLVTVRTPLGKIKVTMKEYKTYFKGAWAEANAK